MGRDRPFPTAVMEKQWGNLPYLEYKGSGEWCAACPKCGDSGHEWSNGNPDRFVIWENGGGTDPAGWCRVCGHHEFAGDDGPGLSPEEVEKNRRERERRERERKRELQNKLEWLRSSDFWLRYHEEMTGAQRKLWYKEGISDWAIDQHKLGYRNGDRPEALSIPYFVRDQIRTLQYRLLCPNVGGKYRFLSGTRPELFRPWPDDELSGVVLVLEGAKKALVTYQEAGDIEYRGECVTMVATPSKTVPHRLIKQLESAEKLIWLLDPDAYTPIRRKGNLIAPAIERNIELAGADRCLVVRAPEKIDDMITNYGLRRNTIESMVNQAGPYYRQRSV